MSVPYKIIMQDKIYLYSVYFLTFIKANFYTNKKFTCVYLHITMQCLWDIICKFNNLLEYLAYRIEINQACKQIQVCMKPSKYFKADFTKLDDLIYLKWLQLSTLLFCSCLEHYMHKIYIIILQVLLSMYLCN